MTVEQLARAVVTIRRKYGAFIDSWGRTNEHSIAVGGFAGDPHSWDLGVDMKYGHGLPNRPGSENHPRFPQSCPMCSEEGLKCLHEQRCDHYQPADFPAGPVAEYGGERNTWA